MAAGGRHQTYRVHHCCWPLQRPDGRTYYALSDARHCLVEIYLEDTTLSP
jgi:hypothetical protein